MDVDRVFHIPPFVAVRSCFVGQHNVPAAAVTLIAPVLRPARDQVKAQVPPLDNQPAFDSLPMGKARMSSTVSRVPHLLCVPQPIPPI
jgi:hypothetical protein